MLVLDFSFSNKNFVRLVGIRNFSIYGIIISLNVHLFDMIDFLTFMLEIFSIKSYRL